MINKILFRLILGFFLCAIIFSFFSSSKKNDTVSVEAPDRGVSAFQVKAENFAPGQLQAHFSKHGYQFGDITESDYLADARKLLDASPGVDVLEKVRDNGDIEHYRKSTHEFAVMTRTGRIRTFFIANDGYWNRQ